MKSVLLMFFFKKVWQIFEKKHLPVDDAKSLFSLSQVIQSVAIIMMTTNETTIEPNQNTPIRRAL